MNESSLVRGGQPVEHTRQHAQRVPHDQGLLLVQQVAQIRAVHVLHDDVQQTLSLSRVVHLHGVWVVDSCRGKRFRTEPADELVAVQAGYKLGMDDFDSDRVPQPLVGRQIDARHAPSARCLSIR